MNVSFVFLFEQPSSQPKVATTSSWTHSSVATASVTTTTDNDLSDEDYEIDQRSGTNTSRNSSVSRQSGISRDTGVNSPTSDISRYTNVNRNASNGTNDRARPPSYLFDEPPKSYLGAAGRGRPIMNVRDPSGFPPLGSRR